ncbi:MAG: FkbM family methyltransferase [Solirubrobacteraceae bacterium]
MRSIVKPAQALSLLPIGAADRRIAVEVYRRFLESGGNRKVTGKVGGATMCLDLEEWPQAQAFLLARYDPGLVRYALRHLAPDGTMIDGGAHVGLITFQILHSRFRARIHAFEPHPQSADGFRRNLREYQRQTGTAPNVTLNETGLSSENGSMPFDFRGHSLGGEPSGTIAVTRLDDYLNTHTIEQVDVLKLDIEGHELAALKGAHDALHAHRIKSIVIETMDAHAPLGRPHDYLSDAGYRRVPMPDRRARIIRCLRPYERYENTAYEPRSA